MKVVNFYFQRISRKIFFVFFLLSISFSVFGQLKGVKHFSVNDGLSNNFVIDITQDGQGFLWIATESGLNRFDGNNFKTYTRNNSDIVSDELNALLYNSKDNSIWICLDGTKLLLSDTGNTYVSFMSEQTTTGD